MDYCKDKNIYINIWIVVKIKILQKLNLNVFV